MRTIQALLITLMGITLFSCSDSDRVEDELEASYNNWLKCQSSWNNIYYYTTTTSSCTGHSSETTTKVLSGQILSRQFVSYILDEATGEKEIETEWTETSAELNSHNDGFPAMLMDDVYKKARIEWLKGPKGATYFLETDATFGLLRECGYIIDGCVDDCFVGVKIIAIVPYELIN